NRLREPVDCGSHRKTKAPPQGWRCSSPNRSRDPGHHGGGNAFRKAGGTNRALVRYRWVAPLEESMKRVAYVAAALACLGAAPAFAASPVAVDKPITLAQLDVRIGGDRDRDSDRWRERRQYRERFGERCRDVTIRERRDG